MINAGDEIPWMHRPFCRIGRLGVAASIDVSALHPGAGQHASVVSHKQLELFFPIFRCFTNARTSAPGLDSLQSLFAPAEFLDDRLNRRCPNERLGIRVPSAE